MGGLWDHEFLGEVAGVFWGRNFLSVWGHELAMQIWTAEVTRQMPPAKGKQVQSGGSSGLGSGWGCPQTEARINHRTGKNMEKGQLAP